MRHVQASHFAEIRVLGPLEVVRDGEAVQLARKEQHLLAALLAEAGRTLSSDVLIDALWPESPPPSAPKLLQVYVSKLRKLLPASARIATSGSGYALEAEDGVLDFVRFERLLHEGREAAQAGNTALAASLLRRALLLWRGAAYGEFAYEEVARAEAERLEELRLVCLEERLQAELELGRLGEMLSELLSLANAHPRRERLQSLAMVGLYRAGRQTEALERYATTRRTLSEELGLEPGAELRELERRILQHDPTLLAARAEPASPTLPTPANPLLGRERELAELREFLLREDVRLLVLTGAGGSGKTRLALEVARQCASTFANGAVLIELAPIRDADLVLGVIAAALGREPLGADPLTTLAAELRARELLLVVDNFEHLREAAPVLVELLSRVPRLTILVTSRVVLHVSGEHVYPVEPLRRHDAVELFVARARDADARFDAHAQAESAIAAICQRLDGLPLAIELAAGHVRALTPEELLTGLEQRLPLLVGGPRDLPARQQTLRATLEWSVDLLDDDERRDLARLSVFAGGWTLESACFVCDTTLERLSSLVDQNLLVRSVGRNGSRYSMLETIRELASQQLEETHETQAIQRRHAERMLAIARGAHLSEDDDEPRNQTTALAERDDLRAALDWAAQNDPQLGLELAVALENFLGPHAPAEGTRRLQDLLQRAGAAPPRLRARALRVLAGAAHQERDFAVADPAYTESLRIFTEIGDDRGVASIRTRFAYRAFGEGDPQRAKTLIEESQRDARGRFPLVESQNELLLGRIALEEGQIDAAAAALNRSYNLASGLSWKWYQAVISIDLMAVVLHRGDLEQAERYGRESLAIAVEEEYGLSAVYALVGLARVALARAEFERAGLLWGAVSQPTERFWKGSAIRAAIPWRADLNKEAEPGFLEAAAQGRELDVWEAAAIALGDETAPSATYARAPVRPSS
jgi:predicted ATPase/DNA-binding SARP family transcriptional activator